MLLFYYARACNGNYANVIAYIVCGDSSLVQFYGSSCPSYFDNVCRRGEREFQKVLPEGVQR